MKKLSFVCFITLLFACNTDITVPVPGFGGDSILDQTIPITADAKQKLAGIYRVTIGRDHFGDRVVIKGSGDYISVFGAKDAGYCVLQAGSIGSELYFEGYWRYATNTETGLIKFNIPAQLGGDYLINAGDSVQIQVSGSFGTDSNTPDRKVELVYERPFAPKVYQKKFFIVAHRGAGRTSDYLPASENTVEMINLAERFGANAIEIDVRLSQDGIPFLYHDETINLRLVQKSPIWGDIEDFSYAQLRSFITLINGERIPSLREALEFVLNETNLNLVWLDMKSGKNDFARVIPIQQDIMTRAQAMGRELEIFVGLPTDTKINQFLQYPGYENILSLNEFEPEDVRRTGSLFWGPRWTLGTQNAKVDIMHGEGRRVITWTMDDGDFINRYLNEADFDGMVTNYPTLVAYYYYSQQ